MTSNLKDGSRFDPETLEPGEYHAMCVQTTPFGVFGLCTGKRFGWDNNKNCVEGLGYIIIVRQIGDKKEFFFKDSLYGIGELPATALDLFRYSEPTFMP